MAAIHRYQEDMIRNSVENISSSTQNEVVPMHCIFTPTTYLSTLATYAVTNGTLTYSCLTMYLYKLPTSAVPQSLRKKAFNIHIFSLVRDLVYVLTLQYYALRWNHFQPFKQFLKYHTTFQPWYYTYMQVSKKVA